MGIITDFTAGEVSPKLKGRPDLQIYQRACLELTNFIPFLPGGITMRPGFEHMGTISSVAARLVPFIISDTLSYVLEFRPTLIRFWKNGVQLMSGGNPLSIITTYSDVWSLQFAQDSGNLYIASGQDKVKVLSMTATDQFTFSDLVITSNAIMPVTGNLTLGSTTIDHISSTKNLSVGLAISGDGIPANTTITQINSDTIVISSAATKTVPSASIYYSVSIPFQTSGNYPKAIAIHDGRLWLGATENEPQTIWASKPFDFGNFTFYDHIINTAKELREPMHQFTGTLSTGSAVITNVSADDIAVMKIGDTIIGDGIQYDYPITITRIQSFGTNSITLDKTVTGNGTKTLYSSWYDRSMPEYEDKEYAKDIITASHAFKKTIASDINESILWFASGNDLIVGTTCGERIIPSGVSATNFICKKQTAYGSARVQPMLFNDSIVFIGSDRKSARAYVFRGMESEKEAYTAPRIDILSDHLLTGVIQIDYASSSIPFMWFAQLSGALIGCVYDRLQNIAAFFRVSITGATIESVCVVPESGADQVYVSVNRSGTRYLERMFPLFSGKHLDNAKEVVVASGAVSGLSWLSGAAKLMYNNTIYDITISGGTAAVPSGVPNGATVLVGTTLDAKLRSMPTVENPLRNKQIPRASVKVLDSFKFQCGYENALQYANITGPYSGDVEIQMAGGWDTEGVITIQQSCLPLTVLAIAPIVNIGG